MLSAIVEGSSVYRLLLDRLVATAAERNRRQGIRPDPAIASSHWQRAHQRYRRAAGVGLRAAVADAHRGGMSVEVIARATGFSPGYVRMIVHRARAEVRDLVVPFHMQGEIMTDTPPCAVGEHLWRKVDHHGRHHHLGTITRVRHDGDRWMVEYVYGAGADRITTAPADEMYREGPMTRPV
ncbi:hypothetical protein [Embleya sp. NPDC020630]|uniref:hypothetical protein n=1 Tax=Embleya sp. NPDC020630 TaxID=3363979 RepID=UPI0037B530EC